MDFQDWKESFDSKEDEESFRQWLAEIEVEQRDMEEGKSDEPQA